MEMQDYGGHAMSHRPLTSTLTALFLMCAAASAATVTVDGVPAYDWYHGCTPTAVASIFGYWDLHGYPNLFDASGAAVFLTGNVQDQISSPEHNAKYDSNPDNSALPDPPDTSIADYLQTSEGNLPYGGTYVDNIAAGIMGYAAYRGYDFAASEITAYDYSNNSFNFLPGQYEDLWARLVAEISAGRPVLLDVDCCHGDGIPDHSIPVLGFDVRADGSRWYGMYTTWSEDETIVWEPYHPLSATDPWGVYDEFIIDPVPEPSAGLPVCAALVILMAWSRRSRPGLEAG
jgi:hypothetical protein